MSNICPIHKKESKNVKENDRPISLLPILGKMFEKVIFDSLYDYFVNNKLLITSITSLSDNEIVPDIRL